MKIGVDARSLLEPTPTGVTRAKQSLLERLVRDFPDTTYRLFWNGLTVSRPLDQEWMQCANVEHVAWRLPNKLINASIVVARRPRIHRILDPVDVVFLPDIQFVSVPEDIPTVVVAHDVSFARIPGSHVGLRRMWHTLARPLSHLKSADAIIAVSEAARREIATVLPEKAGVLHVVRHGKSQTGRSIEKEDRERVRKHYQLPDRYIVAVLTDELRKNALTVVEAVLHLRSTGRCPLPLVLIGPTFRTRFWEELPLDDPEAVRWIGYVREEDLPAIYAGAAVTVYPSLAEGFGFPLIESIAVGTPVIASATTAPPEVIGRGGILVAPDNVREIMDAIEQAVNDKRLRAQLSHYRDEILGQYDWREAAAQVHAIFTEVRR